MVAFIFSTWNELSRIIQIYWIITIVSTLLFLALLIYSIVRLLHPRYPSDGAEQEAEKNESGTFKLLLPGNITAFFAMTGWSGLEFLYAQKPLHISISGSLICGTLMVLAMSSLFYIMTRISSKSDKHDKK